METNESLPLVSVVAVCYNHEKYVVETLDSIINQTYPNIELIIMDDCSKDNSVNVINDWIQQKQLNCIFIPHLVNLGLCKTLNEALSHSNGKYIQFIACDDILFNNKIENQVNVFLKNNSDNLVFVYSDMVSINEQNEIVSNTWFEYYKKSNTLPPTGSAYDEILAVPLIPAPSLLIDKNKILQLGGYDESLVFEDLDFILRSTKQFEIDCIDEPTVYYRRLNNSLSRKLDENYIYSHILLYKKQLRGATLKHRKIIYGKLYSFAKKAYDKEMKEAWKWLYYGVKYKGSFKEYFLLVFSTMGVKSSFTYELLNRLSSIKRKLKHS
jgi:glycosyltransferase involved in cell wall biosynthesis